MFIQEFLNFIFTLIKRHPMHLRALECNELLMEYGCTRPTSMSAFILVMEEGVL